MQTNTAVLEKAVPLLPTKEQEKVVLDALPEGVFALKPSKDTRFTLTFVNMALAQILGVNQHECCGKPLEVLFPQWQYSILHQTIGLVLEKNGRRILDFAFETGGLVKNLRIILVGGEGAVVGTVSDVEALAARLEFMENSAVAVVEQANLLEKARQELEDEILRLRTVDQPVEAVNTDDAAHDDDWVMASPDQEPALVAPPAEDAISDNATVERTVVAEPTQMDTVSQDEAAANDGEDPAQATETVALDEETPAVDRVVTQEAEVENEAAEELVVEEAAVPDTPVKEQAVAGHNDEVSQDGAVADEEAETQSQTEADHSIRGYDDLSGLPNRALFFERAAGEFQRCKRYRHPLSLALTKIEGFAAIRKAGGDQASDEAITAFAQVCQSSSRDGVDILGRVHEDQFAILLPETDVAGALHFVERLRIRLSATPMDHLSGLKFDIMSAISGLQTDDPSFSQMMGRAQDDLNAQSR